MFRTISTVTIALVCSIAGFAADYAVRGTVVAGEPAEPEIYATVRVYAAGDSVKAAALGVTDESGQFRLPLAKSGDYEAVISSVGKKALRRNFTVGTSLPVADLGVMAMADNIEELGEIEVVAQRPLVSKEIDRIGYDVASDADAKTSNLQDVLRKVPLVTVDADGTIKVRGSSDFKIYKNGRPNNSFTKNAKDIFKAIPASMIKKIEVITDPGAREDAEGVGAILNIVTTDNTSLNGVMATVSAESSLRNPVPGLGLWSTANIGKLAFSVYGGAGRQGRGKIKSESTEEYTFAESGNRQFDKQNLSLQGNYGYWGIDTSYELDSLNLFTMEFGGFAYGAKSDTHSSTLFSAPDGSTIYSYDAYNHAPHIRFLDFDGNFNYQRLTRLKDEVITVSYAISHTATRNASNEQYANAVNFPAPYSAIDTDNKTRFLEQTFQADWTRPFGEHNKVTVGAKAILRRSHALAHTSYAGWEDLSTDFLHVTTVSAGYADYIWHSGPWNARAGLRYEYSYLSADYKDGSSPKFHSTLNDWVPNASVMLRTSDASSFKLAWSTRINRPGINFLNPNPEITPTSLSVGNPGLESVRHNSLMLNYSLTTAKISIDAGAGYSFSNNTISRVTTVAPDDFTTHTYGNVGDNRSFDLSLFVQWQITDKTSFMTNAQGAWNKLAIPGYDNRHWSASFYANVTQQLPWKLRLQGYAFFSTGDLDDVYSYSSSNARGIFYGFSLQRSFLPDDRLTVKIDTTCPFSAHGVETRFTTNRGPMLGYSITRMANVRDVSLKLSWRLGSVNADVKKTRTTISNSDLQGAATRPTN